MLLGLGCLERARPCGRARIPDVGTLVAQATVSSEGLVGSAASTLSALLSLAFAMLGVAHLRRSRLVAYRWLERSVLVSLLLGQVLLFWQDQLGAMVELGWNLLLLGALRFAIRQEEARLALARASATQSLPEIAVRP